MLSLSRQRVVQNGLPQNMWFPLETQTEFFSAEIAWGFSIFTEPHYRKKKKKNRASNCGVLLITKWLQCLLTRNIQKLWGNYSELSMTLIFRYPCPCVISQMESRKTAQHSWALILAHEHPHWLMSVGVFCTSLIMESMPSFTSTAIHFWVFFSQLNL